MPSNDDELELVVNAEVTVLRQTEEGWWEGVIDGKTGLFPSNFVTLIEDESKSGKYIDHLF